MNRITEEEVINILGAERAAAVMNHHTNCREEVAVKACFNQLRGQAIKKVYDLLRLDGFSIAEDDFAEDCIIGLTKGVRSLTLSFYELFDEFFEPVNTHRWEIVPEEISKRVSKINAMFDELSSHPDDEGF